MLGYELLKGLNVLDLGVNTEILEERMLREILCTERPELETHWWDLTVRFLDSWEAAGPLLSRSGGEKGLRGSVAGTLGVPLGGTRRVGFKLGLGKFSRVSAVSSSFHNSL